MTEPELVPNVGSRVARYSFIREIARGPLGPLFECREDSGEGASEMLARVVALPLGLPCNDEKQFSDAAWDSAVTTHALSVRVADVVFGKGWFTLVHDSTDGILLSVLEEKAAAFSLTVPSDVAVRIVLDDLEGLKLSREQCDAAQLIWRTGSVSPYSLSLCRDGRTRALDGQVTAAALRLFAARRDALPGGFMPPELVNNPSSSSERLDVFMVGALLWELLTGRKLDFERDYYDDVADVSNAVPASATVPIGLSQALGQALRLDPMQRQGSLRELTVALVMGTEHVANYPEVIDFVDALLLVESSRTNPLNDDISTESNRGRPLLAMNPQAYLAVSTSAQQLTTVGELPPIEEQLATAGELPPREQQPATAVELPPRARLAMISWADELPRQESYYQRSEAMYAGSSNYDDVTGTGIKPLPEVTVEASSQTETDALNVPCDEDVTVTNNRRLPAVVVVESREAVPVALNTPRERQITLPGTGAAPVVVDGPSRAVESTVREAETLKLRPNESYERDHLTAVAFGKAGSKPLVTRAALTSSRPPKADKLTEEIRSGKPHPSAVVQEVLLALEKNSLSKASLAVDDERVLQLAVPRQRQLQLSVSTLVLGFSTTVLAVIVVMLLLMHSPFDSKSEKKSPAVAVPVVTEHVVIRNEATEDGLAVDTPQLTSDDTGVKTVDPAAAEIQLGNLAQPNAVKAGAKPRSNKPSASANKTTSSSDSVNPSEANASGQKHPKNYVPNEL